MSSAGASITSPAAAPSPLKARPETAPVPGWAYGLVLLLALVPRLFQATHTPFQFDEIQTLVLLRHSLTAVLASVHQTVDPPVHYVVLWLWRAIGGEGALWLKALPIVFGLFTVLALLPMGRALFSARAGILGGALLAVNGTHIASSQNLRAYALSWLLLTLIVWLAWRWTLRSRLTESALMFALALTALYTDYYSVFVLFALALWGVLRMRNERRRLLLWIGLWVLVALAFAPHLPAMFGQLGRDVGGERWTLALSVSDLVMVTKSLAFGSVWLIPVLAVVAALPLQRPAQWKAASLLWFLVLLPTLVPWEMSAQGIHLFIARQMLYTLPLWCLLVGAGLAHMRRLRLAFFLGLGLVLFAAVTWLAQWRVVVA